MKKYISALALTALLFAPSCQKRSTHFTSLNAGADANTVFIDSARQYMIRQHYTDSISQPGDSTPMDRTSLHKIPLWSVARVQYFSFGKGVVVPLQITEPLSIRVGVDQIPLTQITWLLLYRDPRQQWQAEVVTRIPFTTNTERPFQGKVRVEDWRGYFLRGYVYSADTTTRLTLSETYKRSPSAPQKTPNVEAAKAPECTETDWYACSSVGGVFEGCRYEYTIEECSTGGGGADYNEGGGGTPTAGDYSSIGGGASGAAGPDTARSTITPDTSITHNPLVNCVYSHRMSTSLLHGLQSILSYSAGNQRYNIIFTLSADVPSDGVCHYQGNNTFLIEINAGEAEDPNYSRIYLASTFIHEAFQAMIRQQALAVFGEQAISQWPTPIHNMTLSQLASYFEAESKAANIWESVEHDWMVDNITALSTSLQEFVQTFYQSTYKNVGSALAPYEALMYMGLQNSPLYQEQVVTTGLQASFENYYAELNEGGKCQE